MNEIKVSVIVPVYNVEQWIERCLDSLVCQTLEGIEIIVVNDGSPDNSQLIIDRYVKEYPEKVVSYIKENGGLSDARNYGLKRAKGEYIAFVDSDDYVDEEMYEKMYNKAIEENSEVVVCGYYKVNDKKHSLDSAQIGNTHLYNASVRQNKDLLRFNSPYAWNKIVKKDLFNRSGITFPKGLNYEDIPTMYPLLALANNVSKVDEELYYYIVQREDSITGTYDSKRLVMIKSLRLLNERFQEYEMFEEYKDQLKVINLRHIYFRLREFGLYKDIIAQHSMVEESFDLLDEFFSGWRTDYGKYGGFNFLISQRKPLDEYQSKEFWHKIVEMPAKKTKDYLNSYINRFSSNGRPKTQYLKCRKKPILSNVVLIESFHGKNISDSPFEIMKELVKRGGYEIFVTSTGSSWEDNSKFIYENNLKVRLVLINSDEYSSLLGRAKYLINNVSFPIYFYRRKDQVYLNTWHGTPLKTLGKNMKKGINSMANIQHNFLQSSHLLFPNKFTKDCIMEDYNLSKLFTNETIISGYPRNTVFSKIKNDGVANNNCGEINYVYMPTWRGNSSSSNPDETNIEKILAAVDDVLDSKHTLYVSLHPNEVSGISFEQYKYIKAFPKDVDKYEFISRADALITDYSSVMFDFSITGKPIILFMYDFDEYMENRGMYVDVRTLPFKNVYSIDELCRLLKEDEILKQCAEYDKSYSEIFTDNDSEDATADIVEYLFQGKISEKMIIDDYSVNRLKRWKVKVQTDRIDDEKSFEEWMKDYNPDTTILAIRNTFFHKKMNDWFYNKYNENTVYIIYRYSRLMSKNEEWLYKRLPKCMKKLKNVIFDIARKRSYMRSLPNINVINQKEYSRLI